MTLELFVKKGYVKNIQKINLRDNEEISKEYL